MSIATLDRPSAAATVASERLLDEARATLLAASAAADPGDRYAEAHLAALRTAAAVLAARPPTGPRSKRPTSAWTLLARATPELSEWATFFAAGAAKRAAALAGLPGAASAREADDLCRDVRDFIAIVEDRLGMLPLAYADRHGTPSSSRLAQRGSDRGGVGRAAGRAR